ncbi:hypothetical protein [Azospirillum endophyticum]
MTLGTALQSSRIIIWNRTIGGAKVASGAMRSFKFFTGAHRLCRAHDEVRNFPRPATRRNQLVLAARRAIHVQRFAALRDMLAVA